LRIGSEGGLASSNEQRMRPFTYIESLRHLDNERLISQEILPSGWMFHEVGLDVMAMNRRF